VRGYADFAPLGHSVRVHRDEEKGTIAWRIKFRNGKKDMELLAPITTKPWGTCIPQLANESAPNNDMRGSQYLFNEPKYIRMDEGGLHTLESNGLEIKEGVQY
jgi:adenylylsulfate reductase subunit B